MTLARGHNERESVGQMTLCNRGALCFRAEVRHLVPSALCWLCVRGFHNENTFINALYPVYAFSKLHKSILGQRFYNSFITHLEARR